MSAKGSRTVASPLDWKFASSMVSKLEKDGEIVWALLIMTGLYTGLRISDLLKLTWSDITGDVIELTEQKTGKHRKISVNPKLKEMATRHCRGKIGFVFTAGYGKSYSRQHVNRELHVIAKKYGITTSFSTHSLRKSMGKRVYESNGSSEKSLVLLSDIFNHASIRTTKLYIGINEENISDCYMNL